MDLGVQYGRIWTPWAHMGPLRAILVGNLLQRAAYELDLNLAAVRRIEKGTTDAERNNASIKRQRIEKEATKWK